MQITVETTEQDHISFYHAYGFKRNLVLKLLILLIVDLILSGSKTHFSVFLVDIVSFGIVLFLFIFLIPYFVARRKFENARRKLLYPDAPKIYKPFALGIEIVEQNEMSFIKYEEIKQVDNAGGYLFIKLFNTMVR